MAHTIPPEPGRALCISGHDVTVVADLDPRFAVETRRRIFDRVASDDMLFTGMHVSFPSFGQLKRDKDGFEYRATE